MYPETKYKKKPIYLFQACLIRAEHDSAIMAPEGDSGDHISMPFNQAKERTVLPP